MSLEVTVQRLQDRVDIHELLYRYCRYADTLDAAAMASLFVEDCEADFMNGQEPIFRGRKQLLEFFATALQDVLSGSHHITNVELIFENADAVIAHTYMYSWQRFKNYPTTADCHRWGRYELRLVRTPEGWQYSRLRLFSAGEYGATRFAEQMARPWPPRFPGV